MSTLRHVIHDDTHKKRVLRTMALRIVNIRRKWYRAHHRCGGMAKVLNIWCHKSSIHSLVEREYCIHKLDTINYVLKVRDLQYSKKCTALEFIKRFYVLPYGTPVTDGDG